MHDGDQTEQRLDTFNLTDSLNAAIAGDASASTALINADYLLKLSAQGGRLPRRQELPPEAGLPQSALSVRGSPCGLRASASIGLQKPVHGCANSTQNGSKIRARRLFAI